MIWYFKEKNLCFEEESRVGGRSNEYIKAVKGSVHFVNIDFSGSARLTIATKTRDMFRVEQCEKCTRTATDGKLKAIAAAYERMKYGV